MLASIESVLKLKQGAAVYGGDMAGGKQWLFDTFTGRHFRLNPVGYSALSLVDGKRSVAEIVDILSQRYDVERSQLNEDIMEFFFHCLTEGMVSLASTQMDGARRPFNQGEQR